MPNNRWRWPAIDRVLGANGNQAAGSRSRAQDLIREEERACEFVRDLFWLKMQEEMAF
jgi:hypothetical protein